MVNGLAHSSCWIDKVWILQNNITLKFHVQISALILKSNIEHKYWKYLLLVCINSLMRGDQISTFTSYYDLSFIFITLSEQLENVWPWKIPFVFLKWIILLGCFYVKVLMMSFFFFLTDNFKFKSKLTRSRNAEENILLYNTCKCSFHSK